MTFIARLLAVVAGAFTLTGTLIAAYDTDVAMLTACLIGVGLSLFGWLYFTEEAERMPESAEYRRVAARLRWELKEENMPPGTKLASTRELAERFDTTRRTATRALHLLAAEGLIDVVRGRGCYVLGPDGIPGPRTDDGPRGRIAWHLINNTLPGDQIPTIEFLSNECQVTQEQARRAVGSLVRKGMIRSNRGRHYRI